MVAVCQSDHVLQIARRPVPGGHPVGFVCTGHAARRIRWRLLALHEGAGHASQQQRYHVDSIQNRPLACLPVGAEGQQHHT